MTLGQTAIALLLALMFSSLLLIPEPFKDIMKQGGGFSYIFAIFFFLAMLQFILPAYFGMRYLGRLPINESGFIKPPRSFDELTGHREAVTTEQTYHYSPFPFSLHITLIMFIAGILLASFAALKFAGPEAMAAVMGPMFLIGFFGPIVYNYVPSPFQKKRTVMASFTGGGSITLFNASWPFFRLLLYNDGMEVRVGFQRYFIPYDKMEALPEKLGFFSRGLLIKSELPGKNLGALYPWPGNIRELEQCIRNIIIRNEYRPPEPGKEATNSFQQEIAAGRLTADELLDRYCALIYEKTGSYQEAARRLGLDRRTAKARIERGQRS